MHVPVLLPLLLCLGLSEASKALKEKYEQAFSAHQKQNKELRELIAYLKPKYADFKSPRNDWEDQIQDYLIEFRSRQIANFNAWYLAGRSLYKKFQMMSGKRRVEVPEENDLMSRSRHLKALGGKLIKRFTQLKQEFEGEFTTWINLMHTIPTSPKMRNRDIQLIEHQIV